MRLAVLSGKGGTGKTLVSVNLAAMMDNALYLDCDVEAPNGRLFFKPEAVVEKPVTVKMPFVHKDLCTGCRTCTEFCNFNAMAYIGGQVKIFEDICHSCGGCALVCPENAIEEKDQEVGHIEMGVSGQTKVGTGVMNIGEASGVPIIDRLLQEGQDHEGNVVIDCPPGSACVVMESIKEADFCLIVAEPTIFGFHNMQMVVELVEKMKKPMGLVINKSYGDDTMLTEFCQDKQLTLLGKINYDPLMAKYGSEGRIVVQEDPVFKQLFGHILKQLDLEVSYEATPNS